MSDFSQIMKLIMGGAGGGMGGGGGPIGTAAEPWNPAAKLSTGLPQPGSAPLQPGQGGGPMPVGQPGAPPEGGGGPPQKQSFGQMMGSSVIPNTMKSMQGKGGASG